LTSDDDKGPGDAKIWVGSQLPEKIVEFCERLETEPAKVDPIEIRMFISQCFVGQAESDAWQRYVQDLRIRPYYDFVRRSADGKLHKYRFSWGFDNQAVRDKFYTVLFDELRKQKLKFDQISALAFMIGSWRSGVGSDVKTRKPQGWHL